MKAANLLPSDRQTGQGSSGSFLTRRPLLTAGFVLAIAAAVLLGFMFHSTSKTISSRQATVSDLDAQIAKLTPKSGNGADSTAARVAAVTATAEQRNSWDGFLYSLSRVVPEDVWLLNLSGTLPAPAVTTPGVAPPPPPPPGASAAAPTGFTLTGYTYSQPSVARLMRRLALLPWLDSVSLVTSTKQALGDHTVYQFTVGANLDRLPEVAS